MKKELLHINFSIKFSDATMRNHLAFVSCFAKKKRHILVICRALLLCGASRIGAEMISDQTPFRSSGALLERNPWG